MSQIIPGITLGNGTYIFKGAFDPNLQTVFGGQPPIPLTTIKLASLFLRTDTGELFVKTAQPNTWVSK
jgi:hypothetical protein